MGSEVSGKVLSWPGDLLCLFNPSCIKGGSWWWGEAGEHYRTTFVKHVSSYYWLLIKNIYDNYTEYLRSVFIINGNRFLSLTKINLVIYSNS